MQGKTRKPYRRSSRINNHLLICLFLEALMIKRWGVVPFLALMASAPAWANLALAQKNACMACHAADKKLVGPSYQDIVKRYAGQKEAEANLAKSIKAGGSGKWGPVPMPAQAGLSDADAKTLAAWILAGGK
jgi:cytochrome c